MKQEVTMTKKLTVLVIAGLMLMSVNLLAGPRGADRDMMRHARFGIHMAEQNLFPGFMLLKHKDEIGLTQDQVKKIEKMEEAHKEAGIRKQADIEVLELKLHSFLKKEPVNRKEMEKMVRDIAAMKTDLQIQQMNYLLDVKDILTPEQLDKIESFKKEKRHRMLEDRMKERGREWRRAPREPREVNEEKK